MKAHDLTYRSLPLVTASVAFGGLSSGAQRGLLYDDGDLVDPFRFQLRRPLTTARIILVVFPDDDVTYLELISTRPKAITTIQNL